MASNRSAFMPDHRTSEPVSSRRIATIVSFRDVKEVSQRFDELGGQQYGVGALVHGLLDVVVDGHFEAVSLMDDQIELVEDALFEDAAPSRGVQRTTFRLRKDLVELRQVSRNRRHRRVQSRSASFAMQATGVAPCPR